ncbi:Tmtc4 [Symbiodinium natans]|uniref:dolichyl-phosphate-mannose--protein mannosyltransferase n=1 Tax=Symbiodinium natans TaxID=878477 RepID=A0A812PPN6_9DINO|nr:Tmtc4 [Symbiodinium natans]
MLRMLLVRQKGTDYSPNVSCGMFTGRVLQLHKSAFGGERGSWRSLAGVPRHAPSFSKPLLLAASCLAAAAALSWAPALTYDFQGGFFMDDAMIQKNPNVYEELNWRRLFRTDYWGLDMFEGPWTHKSFRPLTVLTFRWNHAIHDFSGSGFHIVNVLLNAACAVLLAVFGQHAGLSLDWAVLLGALFLAHPIHTESVLYIVGRADLLCLLLVLLAALIYAPCIKEQRGFAALAPVLAVSASALLVAAGLCKETGFCFFGLLAGWEILRGLTSTSQSQVFRALRLVAILLMGIAACGVRVWYTGGTAIDNMDPHSNPVAVHTDRWVRLRSYALVHGIYAKLLVFPTFLSYDYSFDAIPLVFDATDLRLLLPLTAYLGFGILLVLSLAVLRPKACRSPAEGPIIGLAILILSFVPMSNILFPVGTMIGERLLYIPSAGLLTTLVCLAHRSACPRLLSSLLLLAGGLAVWRSALRVPEWKDSDSITTADGMTQLRSARVQFNLANVYLKAKQYDEALATYQRAIDIDPTDHDALPLYHAGQILFFKGRHQEAARYLEKAVNGYFSPLTIQEEEIWHDYALSLFFMQKPQASVAHFQKALAINPGFTKALNNMACAAGLGAVTGALSKEYYQHAINALDQAVRIDPGNVLYWRNAVALMMAGGDQQRATVTWNQLVAMNPQGAGQPPSDCSWEFYFR